MTNFTQELLVQTLQLSVFLRVQELHKMPLEEVEEILKAEQSDIAQTIAEKADRLLFLSSKKGETAQVFNTLAKGVSLLSVLVEGGVTLFGATFCYPHPAKSGTRGTNS